MARYLIRVEGQEEAFACDSNESVLPAMVRSGSRAIPVGCRRGGCGWCRVTVLKGSYRIGPMSRAHVSEELEAERVALACRIYPKSDLLLQCRPGEL